MAAPVDPDRFIEVLQPDRCPLCFLLQDYVHEHLRNLLEESVTDPISREALFKSRGFCRRHAWQAVGQGKGLGMAVIYASLLEKGLKELASAPKFWKKGKPGACPLCESEKKKEHSQVQQFALAWDQSEELRKKFSEKGVLCLPHLEKVLEQKGDAHRKKNLRETGEKALKGLLKEVNEFLEKQDYHRSHESFGKERDAWVRAVRMISGERE